MSDADRASLKQNSTPVQTLLYTSMGSNGLMVTSYKTAMAVGGTGFLAIKNGKEWSQEHGLTHPLAPVRDTPGRETQVRLRCVQLQARHRADRCSQRCAGEAAPAARHARRRARPDRRLPGDLLRVEFLALPHVLQRPRPRGAAGRRQGAVAGQLPHRHRGPGQQADPRRASRPTTPPASRIGSTAARPSAATSW
ncbi:MAG: hypothetical protein MZU91_08510 [Desulfosudis oleivorans]|nr:hypothetical protein [Desulfosudis oleivorans]